MKKIVPFVLCLVLFAGLAGLDAQGPDEIRPSAVRDEADAAARFLRWIPLVDSVLYRGQGRVFQRAQHRYQVSDVHQRPGDDGSQCRLGYGPEPAKAASWLV